MAPVLCWPASCWPPGLLPPPSLWVLWPEAPGLDWWGPCGEPRQLFMHSSSDAKLLAFPWQPPYQKRLHRPTEAMKYQWAAQAVQEPRALGSRHRTGYAEGREDACHPGGQQSPVKRRPPAPQREEGGPSQFMEHAYTSTPGAESVHCPDLPLAGAIGASRSNYTSTHRTRALQKVRTVSFLDPLPGVLIPDPWSAHPQQPQALTLIVSAQNKDPALSSQGHEKMPSKGPALPPAPSTSL